MGSFNKKTEKQQEQKSEPDISLQDVCYFLDSEERTLRDLHSHSQRLNRLWIFRDLIQKLPDHTFHPLMDALEAMVMSATRTDKKTETKANHRATQALVKPDKT